MLNKQQFQTVYRGLHGIHPDDVDTSNIGPHWTSDYETAHRFAWGAGSGNSGIDMKKPTEGNPVSSTILTAKVHPRNILSLDSDDANSWDVYPDNSENEVFLRDHAPVHIEKVQHMENHLNFTGQSPTVTDVPMSKRIHTRSHLKWAERYDENFENFDPWKKVK